MIRNLFRKKSKKNKREDSSQPSVANGPPSATVTFQNSTTWSTTGKFALLALSPIRKAFEIKEFSLKPKKINDNAAQQQQLQQQHQPTVDDFLQRLPKTLKPRLSEQHFTRLVDAAGHVLDAEDVLQASTRHMTLLVAIPDTETARTCHAWTRDIVKDDKVASMVCTSTNHNCQDTQNCLVCDLVLSPYHRFDCHSLSSSVYCARALSLSISRHCD